MTPGEAPNDAATTAQAAFKAFETETAHIPTEVANESPVGAPAAAVSPGVQGADSWTPESVADQFSGLFALLAIIRGAHWNIPTEQNQKLGNAWLPIFQKHVPYGTGAPSWLGDAIVWIGAIGALKTAAGPALKIEIQLLREAKRKQQQQLTPDQSSPESTQTGTSGESSSLPASEAAENLSSSSESSKPANYES